MQRLIVERLQRGVDEVRSRLEGASFATDQEIRDALWNYFFDVDKSTSWLLSILYVDETHM